MWCQALQKDIHCQYVLVFVMYFAVQGQQKLYRPKLIKNEMYSEGTVNAHKLNR